MLRLAAAMIGLGAASVSLAQPTAPASPNPPSTSKLVSRLIFVPDADKECRLQSFDTRDGRTVNLMTPEICPTQIVSLDERSSVLLITDTTVQEVALAGDPIVSAPLSLPTPGVDPPRYPGQVQFVSAGHPVDGPLSVVLWWNQSEEVHEQYLYVHEHGDWVLEEQVHCTKKWDSCDFKSAQLQPQHIGYEREDLSIWHESQKENPYVQGRTSKAEAAGTENATTLTSLNFDFGDSRSVLSYSTRSGEDTGVTMTLGVSLKVDGKDSEILTDEQCRTSLVGKYLLLQRFWGKGTELIDLEKGRSVLGRLKISRWIH